MALARTIHLNAIDFTQQLNLSCEACGLWFEFLRSRHTGDSALSTRSGGTRSGSAERKPLATGATHVMNVKDVYRNNTHQ
jgi:hypothetical protein